MKVGDIITEGMGLYRLTAHVEGTRFAATSLVSGVSLTIDVTNSGYRDTRHAWRLATGARP